MTTRLRGSDGVVLACDSARWAARADDVDRRVLARSTGPVLDVGCGPGRHVVHLGESGVAALGIDITPRAVASARSAGASVLLRSVFERVPASGRWPGALLLDGNIGIGGSPRSLLVRTRELLAPGGQVLVEVEPPGGTRPTGAVRLEVDGRSGPWFPFAWLGADDLPGVARDSGFRTVEVWSDGGRWFTELRSTRTSAPASRGVVTTRPLAIV